MGIQSGSDSRTLTNNASAVVVLSCPEYTGLALEGQGLGLRISVDLTAKSSNGLQSPTCTVKLQSRKKPSGGSYGSWTDEATETLAIGLAATNDDEREGGIEHFINNPTSAFESCEVQVIASCAGGNVVLNSEWVIDDPVAGR